MATEENGWFQKYVDQVMGELERLDKSVIECSKCVKGKMAKLKPATIVSIIAGLLTLIGLTAGGIYTSYHSSVLERAENTKYMILAESGKAREKFNEYCTTTTFHDADVRLQVLESNVGNIKEDVGDLKKTVKVLNIRSQKVLLLLEKMERKVDD